MREAKKMRFWSCFATVIAAGAAIFALTYLYDRLVLPVRPGRGERIDVLLSVSGDAPGLESTVKGLVFLKDSGRLPMSLRLVDEGMSPDALQTARMLARRYGGITLSEGKNGQRA